MQNQKICELDLYPECFVLNVISLIFRKINKMVKRNKKGIDIRSKLKTFVK